MKTFLYRLRCNEITFNIGAALFFALALNTLFLRHAWETIALQGLHDYFYAASIPLVLFSAFLVIFNLVALPWLRKPLLTALIIASATANYFMFSFGTVIDTNMIQNVFETDLQEASALFNPRYLMWLLLLGGLPATLLCLCQIENNRPWWMSVAWRVLTSLVATLFIVLVAALFYKDYASMIRNNKGVVKMITPANVVSSAGHYTHSRWFAGNRTLITIGKDAKKGELITVEKKKTLVIFVLGETARAENFSLGGYVRETNPKLKRDNVIYYQHATSCGTETAISVPCMFSSMSRQNYDASLARHQEGLLDVMAHAGINILWRENDGGCKGVCKRVPHSDMTQWKVTELCKSDYCLDEVLLYRLNHYIDSLRDDSVIVLHQMGSHGPAYYLRYPPEIRQFTPTCDSNQIQSCDRQALVNTYDNTILYTDSMLDSTINLLKSYNDKFNVAMIYLSDHGESLGEHGIYLHGTPYLFAPEQQTHIPFLLWLSPDYESVFGVNRQCLQQQAQLENVSQDNVFHTLLGMMNVQTQAYQPAIDLIHSCRRAAE